MRASPAECDTEITRPLASGGLQMEQGLALYLKERNNSLSGRPDQLVTGDSAGADPGAGAVGPEALARRARTT